MENEESDFSYIVFTCIKGIRYQARRRCEIRNPCPFRLRLKRCGHKKFRITVRRLEHNHELDKTKTGLVRTRIHTKVRSRHTSYFRSLMDFGKLPPNGENFPQMEHEMALRKAAIEHASTFVDDSMMRNKFAPYNNFTLNDSRLHLQSSSRMLNYTNMYILTWATSSTHVERLRQSIKSRIR